MELYRDDDVERGVREVPPGEFAGENVVSENTAFVSNDRLDILSANQLGRALYSELYDARGRPVNTARFVFLDPRAQTSYPEWDRVATETVAILRSAAGRDRYNRELSDLVGELATQSDAFRTRWATHNVRFHNTGIKQFTRPSSGSSASASTGWTSPQTPV